jgi:hypothetical protein
LVQANISLLVYLPIAGVPNLDMVESVDDQKVCDQFSLLLLFDQSCFFS